MKFLRWLLVFLLVSSMLIALFGSGGWLLRSQAEEVREGWASRSWPAVPARIVRSAAVHKYAASASRRSGQGTHVIDLRYAFEVAGKVYVGRRRSLDWEGKVLTADAAQKHVQGFPMGSMLTAYYDPADLRVDSVEGRGCASLRRAAASSDAVQARAVPTAN